MKKENAKKLAEKIDEQVPLARDETAQSVLARLAAALRQYAEEDDGG